MIYYKIETSKGIIDIPQKVLNHESIEDLKEEDWYKILIELYTFCDIEIKEGWLFIYSDDGYYGSPEYKIINEWGDE